MRTLALAALTMVTAFGASAADAQAYGGRLGGPGASYPVPGYPGQAMPPPPVVNAPPPAGYPGAPYPGQPHAGPYQNGGGAGRWGGSVGGRWSGGVYAPGGWNAYRRPSRGHAVPRYWLSANFYIGDYTGYGLSAPPPGYGWYRYYDDAVLIDQRGRVRDYVDGLDWNAGGYGGAGGYASSAYGYAYAQGGAGGSAYGQPYPQQAPSLPPVVQNGSVTTYSTGGYAQGGYAQGGYAAGGYYYPSPTTTVVTIQSAPTVTTTTTEYIEETTTRTRTHYVAPRRVYRAKKRYYRPVRCGCRRAAPVEQPVMGS